MAKKKKESGVFSYAHSVYTSPKVIEKDTEDWVTFGDKNNYLRMIIEVYNSSPTMQACVNEISRLTYGKGLAVLDDEGQPIESKGNSKVAKQIKQLKEIMSDEDVRRTIFDRVLFSQSANKVVKSGQGRYSKVESIKHWPIITLAPKKMKPGVDTDIKSFYFYPDWEKFDADKKGQLKLIPAWNQDEDNAETVVLKLCRRYKPNNYYWVPMDYSAGIDNAIMEKELGEMRVNQAKKHFTPKAIININRAVETEDEKEYIAQDVKEKYTGSDGNEVIVSINEVEGEEMTIETIQLPDTSARIETEYKLSSRMIALAFNVQNPKIIGLITEGENGLGNNANEIEISNNAFMKKTIMPVREELIRHWKDILKDNGMEELNIGFINDDILDFDKFKEQDNDQMKFEAGLNNNNYNG